MTEEFNEFFNETCKNRGDKHFKVSNSFGVYDAYKLMRKKGWYDIGRAVKEHEFYSIIRGVNNYLAQEITNGRTVVFPSRMGKLELRKDKKGVSIVDGKVKVTYPIDWHETLRLWFQDEEERKKKTLLRIESPYVYKVRYCKWEATYENKTFYEFTLNRFIKRALKEKINNREIDTLW
jgi:hypothetical protein